MLIKLDDGCWVNPRKVYMVSNTMLEDRPATRVYVRDEWVVAYEPVQKVAEKINKALEDERLRRETVA